MSINRIKVLTKLSNTDIIAAWNRTKYPSFINFLNSNDYKKLVENE